MQCQRCLREYLKVKNLTVRTQFSESSLVVNEEATAVLKGELILKQVESHRGLRSVLLGYASASDGRFVRPTDRPTDQLYCCSSHCLSFFPACFLVVSLSHLSRRFSRDYIMSSNFQRWYFRLYLGHCVRVERTREERERERENSPTFFIQNPKEHSDKEFMEIYESC